MSDANILIVGGNGKTGARVNSRLIAAGIQTRCVSRSTTPAFDWRKPDNWQGVLDGISAAYLTYHPDLSVPESEGHIRTFCDMAGEAGVKHIVLLSGRGEEGATRAEKVLKSCGLNWNVLQASWFAQNFSEDFMQEGIVSGVLTMPTGTALEPFIDADDIADVAVATLMEPGLRNRLFELTGPSLLSFADCVAAINASTNHEVTLKELPMQDYLQQLRQQQVPVPLIELLSVLFSELFDGRNAHISNGVAEALGRSATAFEDYVTKSATTGVWDQTSNGRAA